MEIVIIIIIITLQHNKIDIKLMFDSYKRKLLDCAEGEYTVQNLQITIQKEHLIGQLLNNTYM